MPGSFSTGGSSLCQTRDRPVLSIDLAQTFWSRLTLPAATQITCAGFATGAGLWCSRSLSTLQSQGRGLGRPSWKMFKARLRRGSKQGRWGGRVHHAHGGRTGEQLEFVEVLLPRKLGAPLNLRRFRNVFLMLTRWCQSTDEEWSHYPSWLAFFITTSWPSTMVDVGRLELSLVNPKRLLNHLKNHDEVRLSPSLRTKKNIGNQEVLS